jgi:hypothetical protein
MGAYHNMQLLLGNASYEYWLQGQLTRRELKQSGRPAGGRPAGWPGSSGPAGWPGSSGLARWFRRGGLLCRFSWFGRRRLGRRRLGSWF